MICAGMLWALPACACLPSPAGWIVVGVVVYKRGELFTMSTRAHRTRASARARDRTSAALPSLSCETQRLVADAACRLSGLASPSLTHTYPLPRGYRYLVA